jgi:hypothetical protein
MSEERDYSELLSTYNDGTREMLERIRHELNEDAIFSRMEEQYGVYDLLNFNEFNLKGRLERLAFHMKDFKLKYLQELAKVEQVQDRLDKTIGEKYQALKNGEVSLTKTEIEKYYLPVDPQILELKGLLRKQELRAEYFKAVWDAFDKLGWNIRNYVELNKGGY